MRVCHEPNIGFRQILSAALPTSVVYLHVSVSLLTRLPACLVAWIFVRCIHFAFSHIRARFALLISYAHFPAFFLGRLSHTPFIRLIVLLFHSFSRRGCCFLSDAAHLSVLQRYHSRTLCTRTHTCKRYKQNIILYIVHLLKICRYTHAHAHRIETTCVSISNREKWKRNRKREPAAHFLQCGR